MILMSDSQAHKYHQYLSAPTHVLYNESHGYPKPSINKNHSTVTPRTLVKTVQEVKI